MSRPRLASMRLPESPDTPTPDSAATTRRGHERALVDRIRQGDAAAFEALYRSYYRPLLAFILPLTGSGAIAEEVIEDVFAEIWECRPSLVIRHAVNTYIFAAARNRALNARRRARTEQKFLDTIPMVEAVAPPQDIGSLDRERIRQLVREAIDSLPPQRRTVLLLRWDQEMSYAEIAEVMGSSVVAVERQLSRTLKALRLALPRWLRDDHV